MPATIKGIQRAQIHIDPTTFGGFGADATITAVDPAKTILFYVGQMLNTGDLRGMARATLLNPTTVRAYRFLGTGDTYIDIDVVEYN